MERCSGRGFGDLLSRSQAILLEHRLKRAHAIEPSRVNGA
jgi:hypothetical protein